MKDLSEYSTEEILVELTERGKEDTFLTNISTEEMLSEIGKRGVTTTHFLTNFTTEEILQELANRGMEGTISSQAEGKYYLNSCEVYSKVMPYEAE